MKIKKSISKILLSLFLCVCLLPMPFGVMAAGEVTVTVSGGTQITFDAATTAYDVTVPVWYASGVDSYTYENPVITVDNAGEAVAVTMPATLPGDATFVIDGTTYTISLGLAKNMYEDGGFEDKETGALAQFQYSGGVGMSVTDDAAHSGTKSMVHARNYSQTPYVYIPGGVTLQKGKVYLASYAVRVAPNVTMTEGSEYRLRDSVESNDASQSAKATFYLNGVNKGSGATAQKQSKDLSKVISSEWDVIQAVVEPTSATYDLMHFAVESGWNNNRRWEQRLDDIFLSELAVGNFSVLNSEGATLTRLANKEEAQTVNLTAKVLNQLGSIAGFDGLSYKWSAEEGISVINGIVTVPAGTPAGRYAVTATADVTVNNIGTISATHEIEVLASENGNLSSLTIKGIAKDIDFDPSVTSYDVLVPVFYANGDVTKMQYKMPVISGVAENTNATVKVTMPANLPGTASVKVLNAYDVAIGEYIVNMSLLGANLHTNGGFEEEGIPYTTGNTGTAVKLSGNAAFGEKSLEIGFRGDPYYFTPRATLEANKTYLSSRMVRKTEKTDATEGVSYRVDTFTGSLTHYPQGGTSTTATNAKTFVLALEDSWKTFETLITPSTAWEDKQMYHSKSWSKWSYAALDNCFLGELIIGGVKLYADGVELPANLATDKAYTFNLTAKAVNQLGSSTSVEDKTTATILGLENAPDGVTLENGVLTIPENAEGTLTIKAQAVPTASWSNAPQTSFIEDITMTLVKEDGSLSALTVSGSAKAISFEPEVTSYDVLVPVSYKNGDVTKMRYQMPVISATANNPNAAVKVTMPVSLPGAATIAVINAKEDVIGEYTVNMSLLGTNLYTNAGFEESGVPYNQQNGAATVVQTNPYNGSNCLEIRFKGDPGWMTPRVTLNAGKTYLSSRMIRTTENTTQYNGANDVYYDIDSLSNATSTFYHYGKSPVTVSGTVARHALEATSDWSKYDAVITPGIDWEDTQMYRTGNWARTNYLALDNCFLGELIIGGAALAADGEALPSVIPTTSAHTLTVTAQAINQLGGTAGLEDRTTAEILSLENAPAGVTYENGVLTIPQGAEGTLTFTVQVAPTAAWTNAKQEGFTETVTIQLTKNAFTYTTASGKVNATLSMYHTGTPGDAVLYHAVYNNNGGVLYLQNIVKEDIFVPNGEFFCKETELTVASGQVVKSFLWEKGYLIPFVANGVYNAQ